MSGKRRKIVGTAKKGAAKPNPKAKRSRLRQAVRLVVVTSMVLVLVGLGGLVFLYQSTDLPRTNAGFETETTYVFYDGGTDEVGRFAADQNRESIPLSDMPDLLKDAVVAAENRSFWTDRGLDPKGILRAAFTNATTGSSQGASTITQQYVKILYLTSEQRLQRKLTEAILSLKIQRQMSKQRVLEGYLNTIYFGRGAYGVQAASKTYFGIDAKKLNLRQSAFLATVINNPTRFDPANGKPNRQAARARYQYVLNGMLEMGAINSTQHAKAAKALPKFSERQSQSAYGGHRGHMLTMVRKELIRLGFSEAEVEGGGLRITTTFTPEAMEAAREGVESVRPAGFSTEDLHVGVGMVEPGTGAVRGFYAGQDFLESQINWAVAGGQAGSTFKAFAVAAGIEQGFSLKNQFDGNSPYKLPDGTVVGNQFDRSYGRVDLTRATQDSINTAFIDMTLAMDRGPQSIVDTAVAMGIPPRENDASAPGFPNTSPGLNPNTGVALGSQTVSPINMANGYATLANGGVAAEPYIIERVVDRSGQVRYEHEIETERAVDEDIAADVTYALQQVVEKGSGSAAKAVGRPVAGKTGTATNARKEVSSAWFAGYTPQMSVAVMYVRGKGNEQLKDWLPEYFGGAYPARTFATVMRQALEGQPVEQFPPPANVTGTPPSTGHEPYTPPPPPPPKEKKPTKEKKDDVDPTPTPTPTPAPTTPPTSPIPPPECDLSGCSPPPTPGPGDGDDEGDDGSTDPPGDGENGRRP
ncbi:transglycosylase domain-containing protein [Nocardioides limicola]|uniref:transglycosylase domain-containing protein n=1 Tax=Nocardioides limicola TaxID=2803368 RepID=UPI0027DB9C19|nr:transglycosylase domain-containing protein [Nocardioides sp. DJM-14]